MDSGEHIISRNIFPRDRHWFLTIFVQTGRAIKFAVDHVFSSSQRANQVKNRIAVVVTDGKSQDDVVNVPSLWPVYAGGLKLNSCWF